MEIDVMSVSDSPHSVEVTVYQEDQVIFEKVYEMKAGEGDSSEELTGEPTDIHVDISEGTSEQFEFRPPEECENVENDPQIVLTIYDANDVSLTYGCGS